VFTLAFDPATGTFGEDELNRFCLGKRVLVVCNSAYEVAHRKPSQ
jgi:hypothetical protein